MQYRLTKFDEWPRHQTGGTFDVVVDGSPHWSDGYYFTTGSPDGSTTLFVGFRLYANTDVLDAFAVVSAGAQSVALVITIVVVGVVATLLLALIQAALQGIYAAALYRYATGHQNAEGFSGGLLENAFAAKRS